MADDRAIDDALRDVAVPAGIAARMSLPELFTDAAIDGLLADVAVPAGFVERLRAAVLEPASAGGAIDLDRIGLATGPIRVRPARPVSGKAGRWLAALARDGGLVALSLCGVAALFLGGVELSRRLERGGAAVTVAARPEPPAAAAMSVRPVPVVAPARPAAGDLAAATPRPLPAAAPPAAAAGDPAEPARPADLVAAAEPPIPTVRGAPLQPPAGAAETAVAGMRFVDLPVRARRGVPRVRGYDLAFELAHGEAPFVDPAADAALAVDRPPLSQRTDTFDALRLDPGRRPSAGGRPLQAEHVLAALPAAPPPPNGPTAGPGSPRLDLHVVRSLRKVAGVQTLLVEACVTAPPLDRGTRAAAGAAVAGDPLDATVVLDRAAGGAALAWPWTCRALAATAAQMGPRDRLTVVVAGPEPQVVLRRRGAADVASLATALERLSPAGFSDLDAALRLARNTAGGGARLVVVAHAGSLQRGGGGDLEAALASASQAARGGQADGADRGSTASPRLVIIDPALADDSGADAAESGRTAADPVALRRALLRQVFAVPTVVARHCSLAVAFPPAQVAAYRIIGHRQSVVDSLSSDPAATVDLHAGETVRVAYEILPRPGAGGAAAGRDLVAATLSWRGLSGGAPQEARTTIGGGPDVTAALPSAHGCELLLAVGLGDVAGESAHVGRRSTTAAALATVVHRWQARGDVTPGGTVLIGCLERWAAEHRGGR